MPRSEPLPVAEDEHGNVELRRYGEPYAIENPKDHVDLGAGGFSACDGAAHRPPQHGFEAVMAQMV